MPDSGCFAVYERIGLFSAVEISLLKVLQKLNLGELKIMRQWRSVVA